MTFRSEFQLKRLGFTEVKEEWFHTMHFLGVPPKIILCYRVVISTYFIINFTWAMVYFNHFLSLAFLTNWSMILCTTYYVTITTTTTYEYCFRRSRTNQQQHTQQEVDILSTRWRIVWILFESSHGVAMLVTIMYWGFVCSHDDFKNKSTSFLTVSMHLVNYLLLVIDLSFHRIPVRLVHVVYPIIFGVVYVVFNVVYTRLSKRVIYKIMDWEYHPGWALLYTFMAVAVLMVAQLFAYGLYRVKLLYLAGEERRTHAWDDDASYEVRNVGEERSV